MRWMVMRTISQHMYDDEMAKSLREIDLTNAGAPLLAVAARAWLGVDPEKAMALLRPSLPGLLPPRGGFVITAPDFQGVTL